MLDSDDSSIYDKWVSPKYSFELSWRNLPAAHYELLNNLFTQKGLENDLPLMRS